ncbi:MAG: Gfo/Idh/MocA family oxidoreductase [Candidatus Lindowbacteria bacterium]|nr:Gfo/Idh/MocA family oxidoreductase [Candidatus Lindowbacteria bacterium]
MTETNKLRAGIIGMGVGEAHIVGYEAHPDCVVTAVCDFDEEKLGGFRDKYPDKKVVSDANEILDDPDIDVVTVASYDNFHHEQIVRALKNGKHVFAEKPLVVYEDEAKEIRQLLAHNPNLKLSSNLILRQCPRFQNLHKMIQQGDFGEIYQVEGDYNWGRIHKITEGWRGKLDFHSAIYGGGVHIIDLLLWFTGKRVIEVFGYGTNIATKGTQYKFHDASDVVLKFEDGIIGKLSANYSCVYPHFHRLSIYGTDATFENRRGNALLYRSRDPETPPEEMTDAYPGAMKGDLIMNFIEHIL